MPMKIETKTCYHILRYITFIWGGGAPNYPNRMSRGYAKILFARDKGKRAMRESRTSNIENTYIPIENIRNAVYTSIETTHYIQRAHLFTYMSISHVDRDIHKKQF